MNSAGILLFAAATLAAIAPAGARTTDGAAIVFEPGSSPFQPPAPFGPTVFGPMIVKVTNPTGPIKDQKVTFSVPGASGTGMNCIMSGGRNPREAEARTDAKGKAALDQLRGHNSLSCKGIGQATVTATALGVSATMTVTVTEGMITVHGNNQTVRGFCRWKGNFACTCNYNPITFVLALVGKTAANKLIGYSDDDSSGTLKTGPDGSASYQPPSFSGASAMSISGTATYKGLTASYAQTCTQRGRK